MKQEIQQGDRISLDAALIISKVLSRGNVYDWAPSIGKRAGIGELKAQPALRELARYNLIRPAGNGRWTSYGLSPSDKHVSHISATFAVAAA